MQSTLSNEIQDLKDTTFSTAHHFAALIRSHEALLKEEIQVQKQLVIKSVILGLGGLIAVCVMFASFSVAIATLLYRAFPALTHAGALAIVGALWVVATALFANFAVRFFKQINVIPTSTITSLLETMACLLKRK